MRLEYESEKQFKKHLLRIIGSRLDLRQYKVFSFGSRVTGGGNARSDIDIGIEGPQKIPIEILETIIEDVDALPLLYKIDIVDFKRVPEKFKKVALKQIEPL